MRVDIIGFDPPGRSCGAGEDHVANIHVGLGIKAEPHDLFRGDEEPRWTVDVNVVDGDFRGKFVHGKKGERFLYLNWGDVGDDGAFRLFRRAKIMLTDVDTKLVESAERDGKSLVARVALTDAKGFPTCARLRPPQIEWSLA
jgi:hypothetical protein